MINKGIILTGGYGTRLNPTTKLVNKHMLPIFDKPMIYYSLSLLFLCKVKNILIITNKHDQNIYKKLLGNGKDFGVKISYIEQSSPKGLPDAFILGKNFINKDKVLLLLGDNFFHGQSLTNYIQKNMKNVSGCKIFTYIVNNPSDYGVLERNKKKFKILEKPKKTKSNEAIVGLYMFDNSVIKNVNKIKPSKRGELEIVDLINLYNDKGKLKVSKLGRGSTWLDTGNPKNLLTASNYVSTIQDRQNLMIGCPEEIAYMNKWIDKDIIRSKISTYNNCDYSSYLKKVIDKK